MNGTETLSGGIFKTFQKMWGGFFFQTFNLKMCQTAPNATFPHLYSFIHTCDRHRQKGTTYLLSLATFLLLAIVEKRVEMMHNLGSNPQSAITKIQTESLEHHLRLLKGVNWCKHMDTQQIMSSVR